MPEQEGAAASFQTFVRAALLCILTPCLLVGLSTQSTSLSRPPAPASSGLGAPSVAIPLTLQKGTAFSVALDHRVPINHVGEPVEGKLVQPVYAFDRVVAPAGSVVLGHVTAVKSAPRMERVQAIMQGAFTPLRTAQVEFDTLVTPDGQRIPIQTIVSPATAAVVHLQVAGPRKTKRKSAVSRAATNARQQAEREKKQIVADIRSPGRMHRLKEWMIYQLPYHRQFIPSGARFTAALDSSVTLGSARVPVTELKLVGSAPPADSIVDAVLVTPLSSATARRGAPVEALVTRPVFSQGHELVIPEGSKLMGEVLQAEPARRLRLHRNGILRFTFQQIQPPHGVPHPVEGNLQGVVVDKKENLKLDSEGGAHSTTSKMDYAKPAIAVLIAAASAMPDVDVREGRVYTDTNGPAAGQILGGGLGYKLIGMAMTLAMRYQPVTAGFAAYGAAWSVYSHLLSRGQDVVFPKDTPMEIRLSEHRPAGPAGARHTIPPGGTATNPVSSISNGGIKPPLRRSSKLLEGQASC